MILNIVSLNKDKVILRQEEILSDIDKIIQKMKRQPHGIRFKEITKVLEYNGYIMKTKKWHIS